MRLFINLFLLLFLMDGTLSFFDDLLSLFSVGIFLTGFRNILASVVIFLACPVYLCLGIDKRLPKSYILPLIAFIYLSYISVWIFPMLGGNRLFGLFISSIQILLVIRRYSPFRAENERNLFLSIERFNGPIFNWKNSVVFFCANIFIIPPLLLTGIMATADSYADQLSSGFMRIAPTGLNMGDRTYQNNGKTIRLIAMIHIG